NRLRKGMMLQSDPTVSYALGIFRNRVYYNDLNVKSPYNTYRNRGLPPGPICSPGRAAFHAVLFPLPDSTELYFVARGDGTHIFTKSWAAHLAAIAHVRAVAKVESTPRLAGPLMQGPVFRAVPDSALPALRAEAVSAPAGRAGVLSAPAGRAAVVSAPAGRAAVVSAPQTP